MYANPLISLGHDAYVRCCSDPRANGKRANGKFFAPVTSDVWTLIRSIKYSLIKKLIT
jgi:hypothetical protein